MLTLASLKSGPLELPYALISHEDAVEHHGGAAVQARLKFPTLIIGEEIPTEWRQAYTRDSIAFADLKGAFFIPLRSDDARTDLAQVVSRRAKKATRSIHESRKGFETLALAILSNPKILKESQRTLAKTTDLSLVAVNRWLSEMIRDGYLRRTKRGLELVAPKDLFPVWADRFIKTRLPRIKRETFSSTLEESPPAESWLSAANEGYWSGELAADTLTGDIRPSRHLLYCPPQTRTALIKKLRLKNDPNGDIELRPLFWSFPWAHRNRGLAPPPLIAADLMASNSDRNYTAASKIMELWFNDPEFRAN